MVDDLVVFTVLVLNSCGIHVVFNRIDADWLPVTKFSLLRRDAASLLACQSSSTPSKSPSLEPLGA